MTLLAYKYRILPNKKQKLQIESSCVACRFVSNKFLSLKRYIYTKYKKNLSMAQFSAHLTRLKKKPGYEWLQDVNSQALQSALRNVETAYERFFKQGAGFPKFRKRRSTASFANPQHVQHLGKNRFKIPKLGTLIVKEHRDLPQGLLKTCTISRDGTGKYFLSVIIDTDLPPVAMFPVEEAKTQGLDLGIHNFVATSDGALVPNPKSKQKQQRAIAQEQKKLARKQRGSNNSQKQKGVVARQYKKACNQTKDFHHKISHQIANESQVTTVCVEDLNIKNMLKNRCLARAIQDCGWGQFLQFLSYNLERRGSSLIVISQWKPSSKECRMCHKKHPSLTLKDRTFVCPHCGHEEDRDLHAAKNIRRFGLQQYWDLVGMPSSVKSSCDSNKLAPTRESSKGSAKKRNRSEDAPSITVIA
jgi:putative transposase